MKRILFIGILFTVMAQGAFAQTFSVQGVLRDPLGKTVDDGNYSITFRLYEQSTGGTAIWNETQGSVEVLHGVFNVELGIVNSLSDTPFDTTYWLGISIEGGTELEPRFKLLKAPSALSVLGTDNVFPSKGNIGSGTLNPTAGLHIVTQDANTDLLKIESDAGGFIEVTADGKMGVNVADPTNPLSISGNLRLKDGGAIVFDDATSIASANYGGSATGVASPGNALLTSDADGLGTGEIQFFVDTGQKMVIDHDGNVGIGTASPSNPLTVSGNADFTGSVGIGTASPQVGIHGYNLNRGSTGDFNSIGAVVQMSSPGSEQAGMLIAGDDDLDDAWLALRPQVSHANQWMIGARFYSGSAFNIGYGTHDGTMTFPQGTGSKFTILTNGNVGIGTTEPVSKLDVRGDIRYNGALLVTDSAGTSYADSWIGRHNDGTNDWLHIGGITTGGVRRIGLYANTIYASGNVGIGTTSPNYPLSFGNSLQNTKLAIWDGGSGNSFGFGVQNNQFRFNVATTGDRFAFLNGDAGSEVFTIWGNGSMGIWPDANWVALPYVDVAIGDHDTGLNWGGDGKLDFYSNGGFTMRVQQGNVGIGDDTPTEGKLVVRGVGETLNVSYYYLSALGGHGGPLGPTNVGYSIYAGGRILSPEFNAVSDRRTKNILGDSDSQQDLETINKLKVRDYTFIDVINKGNRPQKKLIGQQVLAVYPQAVNISTEFIPDVYEMSMSTTYDADSKRLTITIAKAHDFIIGDKVRIVDNVGTHEVEILAVADEHTFIVSCERASEEVFVIGRQVDDFLAIDYDAISMLNVSATQELARQVEGLKAENAVLKTANTAIKAENVSAKAEFKTMRERLTQVESLVEMLMAEHEESMENEKVTSNFLLNGTSK